MRKAAAPAGRGWVTWAGGGTPPQGRELRSPPRIVTSIGARFDVLWRLTFRPRIIAVREYEAFRERRMRVKPKCNESWGIRIGEVHFAQDLKGMRRDLL